MKSSLLERLPAEERKLPRRAAQPEWLQPMLATLTHDHFSNPEWIFEPKLDGERCLAFRKGRRARLLSRNRKELNDTYPELVDALERQKAEDFVVDGEIVALRGSVTSFSQLQQRMQVRHASELLGKRVPIFYYLFDLPFVDGYDTTKLALDQRKALLKDLLTFKDPLRYSEHRDEEGEAYLAEACRMGWEGLIAKRTDSPYVHARSRDWLKFKCINEQEFVIGGFTDPKGSRVGFGALLLGYYQHGKLKYAGQVGTGFNTETLRRLHDQLSSIERDDTPFEGERVPRSGVHWVEPRFVAQCGFTEWTSDDKLRHPRFVGLRRDKEPREVLRERP